MLTPDATNTDQPLNEEQIETPGRKIVPARHSRGPSHVVSFRLSQDRFDELEEVCKTMEGATPSELAREMVCAFLQARGNPGELALSLAIRRLVVTAGELKCEVDRIAAVVAEKTEGASLPFIAEISKQSILDC